MQSSSTNAYPYLPVSLNDDDLSAAFTPTQGDIDLAEDHTHGLESKIFFLTLLKSFQRVGYFVRMADVPRAVAEHISLIFGVNYEGVPWEAYESRGTRRRHVAVIREHLGVRSFDGEARKAVETLFREVAEHREEIDDFVNAGVEELIRLRYELPAYRTLSESAGKIRAEVNRRYFSSVRVALGPERIARIGTLLVEEETEGRFTLWNRVRTDLGVPTVEGVRALVARKEWLESLDLHRPEFFAEVPRSKLDCFATDAESLSADRMWELVEDKRVTLAAVMVSRQIARILDDLGTMIVRRVRKMHTRARETLREYLWEQQSETDRLIAFTRTVLETWKSTGGKKRVAALEALIAPDLDRNLAACVTHEAHAERNHLPFLWKFHKGHRKVLFEAVQAVRPVSTIPNDPFPRVLEFVLRHRTNKKASVAPVDVEGKPLPLEWIPERWWKFVTGEARRSDVVTMVDRRAFEMAFFTELSTSLQNGDLVIAGSNEFSDYRNQLVSTAEFTHLLPDFMERMGLDRSAENFIDRLRKRLGETAERVDLEFPDNEHLRIENGLPVLSRLDPRPLPAEFRGFQRLLRETIPPHDILDILSDVQSWTDFAACFGVPSGTRTRLEQPARHSVFSVFAYGCNLGPSQAARSLPETTRRELSYFNQRHVTLKRLEAASRRVLDAYAKLPLHRAWGTGKSASADGTKREIHDGNLLAEYHIRYGFYGGIEYFHVSDTYAAIFSHFIPCSLREAVFILDGLLRNESQIRPEIIHSDSHGQTAAVFGIAHLLGIRLMPRIKNWKDLDFCRSHAAEWYNHIGGLFTVTADWKLIAEQYDDMLRVIVSIHAGRMLPSTILRRFGSASRANRLALAFRELGRVIRTIFLLEYIDDLELRRTIHDAMNKSERFNQFKQFIAFGGRGLIATNDRGEQSKRVEYTRLVANCVVLHNAWTLTKAIRGIGRKGIPVTPESIGRLSPFLTEHINRFGTYSFKPRRNTEPIDFKLDALRGLKK